MSKLTGEKVLMRIFTGEQKRYGHKPLYEALVELFRKEGLAGATVLRGVSGFGAHRIYHTQKLLELSVDLPIVIEVVETQERIDAIMPKVDEMIESGLVTLEKVTVIRYTHKHANE
jgi:PII-like signaling protein